MDRLNLQTFPALRSIAGLRHALTTRAGGVSTGPFAALNLGTDTGDTPAAVIENRRRLTAQMGFEHLHLARQVHGRRIVEVDAPGMPRVEADALVLRRPGVLGGVLSADCPLALLVDPLHGVLALVHSGWRGTVAGVVPAVVEHLSRHAATEPSALVVGIGPAISAPRYEVGAEVRDAVRALGRPYERHLHGEGAERAHVDLVGVIRTQLESCGIPAGSVTAHPACTFDAGDAFFSYRRDGARTGRHALVAGWT